MDGSVPTWGGLRRVRRVFGFDRRAARRYATSSVTAKTLEDSMALPPIYDPEAVKPMWQELAAVR